MGDSKEQRTLDDAAVILLLIEAHSECAPYLSTAQCVCGGTRVAGIEHFDQVGFAKIASADTEGQHSQSVEFVLT